MTIARAEWHEILGVLHETHRIWSVGMNRSDYQRFLELQLAHAWSRRHYRYMVSKRAGQVASSCKLYDLGMTSRGERFRVAGVGAVFTQEKFRGTGCAGDLIDDVIELAEAEGYDGLLLYTEIGTEFYAQFGFEELGSCDVTLSAPPESVTVTPLMVPRQLTIEDVPLIAPHHTRWLRKQPYGIVRSLSYWHYKLSKESFIRRHSSLPWPTIELVLSEQSGGGYMLMEQGDSTLRLIEIVGGEEARIDLWRQGLSYAGAQGITRLRGWEALARDLAPGYSLNSLLPDYHAHDRSQQIHSFDREWGEPMLLAINDRLSAWTNEFPCPLLELDHC